MRSERSLRFKISGGAQKLLSVTSAQISKHVETADALAQYGQVLVPHRHRTKECWLVGFRGFNFAEILHSNVKDPLDNNFPKLQIRSLL